jgi:diadenosine tetraphosphate (Ap4A) HIT family hydrolase
MNNKSKKYVDPINARTEEYRDTLLALEKEGIDPFTKENLIREGKVIILETPHWFAFHNEHPYTGSELHLVLVCKEYAEALWDLSEEAQLDLISFRKKLCEEFNVTGGASVGRFGHTKKTGATVYHYHEHIIVPKDGEKVAAWFGSGKEE